METKEIPFGISSVETIDQSVFTYVDETLNIHSMTNKGFKKVPVVWVTAERAYQIKNDVNLRDKNGLLTLPVITIERTGITKSLTRKGAVYGNVNPVPDAKGGTVTIAREINQFKSANFINADLARLAEQETKKNKNNGVMFVKPKKKPKIVYETITIPLPIYIETTYSIRVRTEYQQQLNEIMTPFITRPNGLNYVELKYEEHMYEGFLGEAFTHENNISSLGQEERKYETSIELRVLGYVIGDDKNQESPRIVRRQNFVDVKFPREHVILDDKKDYDSGAPGDPFYRE